MKVPKVCLQARLKIKINKLLYLERKPNQLKLLSIQVELEFGNVSFCGGRKTEEPDEKRSRSKARTKNKLNPHMTLGPEMEPGSHWWGRGGGSTLTTGPSLLPIVARKSISIKLS